MAEGLSRDTAWLEAAPRLAALASRPITHARTIARRGTFEIPEAAEGSITGGLPEYVEAFPLERKSPADCSSSGRGLRAITRGVKVSSVRWNGDARELPRKAGAVKGEFQAIRLKVSGSDH
jgi:hypothetical protein